MAIITQFTIHVLLKFYETNKKQYGFPDEAEIKRVIKRMAQPGYRRINQGLKLNATTEDKIKHNLCKNIVRQALKKNLTEEELTKKLKIDQVKIECILFCHIILNDNNPELIGVLLFIVK